jgi:hypothetical protein
MDSIARFALASLLGVAALAQAQTVPPPPRLADLPPATPAVAASAAAAASAPIARAPAAHVQVAEDDNVRIEETRVRGQLKSVTVQNKSVPLKGYEIIVPAGGKDPSQDRGAAGQRAWSLFAF